MPRLELTPIIIEASNIGYGFGTDCFVLGLRNFGYVNLSDIKEPSIYAIKMETKIHNKGGVLSSSAGYINWWKTHYPEWEEADGTKRNFATANAMSVDMNQNTISEDLIVSQFDSVYDTDKLSKKNFVSGS